MAILKVARLGHPILRQIAAPIPVEAISTSAVQNLIQDMYDTVQEYDGLGLAAPQVHIGLRLVLLVIGDQWRVLVNPEITPLGDEFVSTFEGCLSVPGLRGRVERCASIRLQALDQEGNPIDEILEDMDAIVVQHECDHLDGVLYVDRCEPTSLSFLEEYRRYADLDADLEE